MPLNKLKKTLKYLCNAILDKIYISRKIEEYEIFVRSLRLNAHIKDDDFPPRKFEAYFMPHVDGGVSINRYRYANEDKCKELGMKIPDYKGVAILSGNIFKNSIEEYIQKNPNENLETFILSTPLDYKDEIITKTPLFIFDNRDGNSAHADIRFGPSGAGIPSNFCRKFSKILAANSKKLIDERPEDQRWLHPSFKTIINSQ